MSFHWTASPSEMPPSEMPQRPQGRRIGVVCKLYLGRAGQFDDIYLVKLVKPSQTQTRQTDQGQTQKSLSEELRKFRTE